MAKMTRFDELQKDAAERGYYVARYSPGDGQTRYRFFDLKDVGPHQDYFGPKSGVYTALGLKEAYSFLGVSTGRRSHGKRPRMYR